MATFDELSANSPPIKKPSMGGPDSSQESAQKSSVDIANHVGKAMNHYSQGHEGEYQDCANCHTQPLSKQVEQATGTGDPKAVF